MSSSDIRLETLHDPVRYTVSQLERAFSLASRLNRGKLVLIEPPGRA